jgi:hypothetical protein
MEEKEYFFKTAIEIYEISMYEKVDKGWDKKSYTKHFMTYQDAVRYVTKYYSKDAIFVAFPETTSMFSIFDGREGKLLPIIREGYTTYPRFMYKTEVTKSYTI